jgi:hypothetical protein
MKCGDYEVLFPFAFANDPPPTRSRSSRHVLAGERRTPHAHASKCTNRSSDLTCARGRSYEREGEGEGWREPSFHRFDILVTSDELQKGRLCVDEDPRKSRVSKTMLSRVLSSNSLEYCYVWMPMRGYIFVFYSSATRFWPSLRPSTLSSWPSALA